MENIKEDFLETCIVLCGLDKESIIKTILSEKFKIVRESQPSGKKNLPKSCDLLLYTPSAENFVEYAYQLCSMKESKEVITRHLLSAQLDATVEAVTKPSRVRTRQSKQRSENIGTPSWKKKRMSVEISSGSGSDSESVESPKESKEPDSVVERAARLLCTISNETKLPSKLNLFKVHDKVLNTMSEILPVFFPETKIIWPGIYAKGNTFVLLVIDNGRYKNNWKACGIQNKLTWFTPTNDADKSVFDKIVDSKSVIHVIRKRNGEMRYMGTRVKIEDTNRQAGSCVLYVA